MMKLDARYSIRKEYIGKARPQFVVRFCGKYIDHASGYEFAHNIALHHRINFCKSLEG